MLQNTILDQSLDQEPLVLVAWEQGEREAWAAPAAKTMLTRRLLPILYDGAIALLLLTSLAAIGACFAWMN